MTKKKWLWAARALIALSCAALLFIALKVMLGSPGEGALVVTHAPTETAGSVSPSDSSQEVSLSFIESAELRMPGLGENLPCGQRFHLRGTVQSGEPLTGVTITIRHEQKADPLYPYTATVTFEASDHVTSYALEDTESPVGGASIDDLISCGRLLPGRHSLTLTASTVSSENITLFAAEFIVDEPSEWTPLISNNFRNNYLEALAFFKEPERFLFQYKWADGRNIITDPAWVEAYITSVTGVGGKKWQVHVDAVPYFEKAVDYLENTYVRVQGNGHDSGVIRLSKLIKAFNGSYYSRFVTEKTFVSHHAFGTAIDLNAALVPNNNDIQNHDIIRHEVRNCLAYDGIVKSGGKSYYSFTYTGEWQEYHQEVPATVLNYLLYELAFYRAGFGWGYYYPHTCDAMHFTLSERNIAEHGDADTGLRKVYAYAE